MNNECIGIFKIVNGREHLSEILDITKVEYVVIDNSLYVYRLVKTLKLSKETYAFPLAFGVSKIVNRESNQES